MSPLEWKCDAPNAVSGGAVRHESIILSHVIVKGRSRNTDRLSLTQEEWPAVCDAHGYLFAPDDFEAWGHRKRSLSDLARAIRRKNAC